MHNNRLSSKIISHQAFEDINANAAIKCPRNICQIPNLNTKLNHSTNKKYIQKNQVQPRPWKASVEYWHASAGIFLWLNQLKILMYYNESLDQDRYTFIDVLHLFKSSE